MTGSSATLTLLAQTAGSRTYYEVTRLAAFDQWWHWLVLLLLSLAVLAVVVVMYLFDARELPRGKRWLLLVLRALALAGILVFFLDVQKRTQQELVQNSRFALLIDTSQSMSLSDGDSAAGSSGGTRIDQIVDALGAGKWLEELRQKHDVSVYRFDASDAPQLIGVFSGLAQVPSTEQASGDQVLQDASAISEARVLYAIAATLLALSGLAFLGHLLLGNYLRSAEGESWALLGSVVGLIVGFVFIALSSLRNPDVGLAEVWGGRDARRPTGDIPSATKSSSKSASDEQGPEMIDWKAALGADGAETRLGEALRWLVEREQGGPIAGIGLLSDGNSNRGVDYTVALEAAKEAGIPVFAVGLGSDRRPVNIRVVDLEAPPRVYPGDQFSITGYLQAYGREGRNVAVQLLSRPDNGAATETLEDERWIKLPADGQVQPTEFQLTPEGEGRRVYTLRVANGSDRDDDPGDNQKSAKVQIVDRKVRVLLLAGGPTREYRFLRNLLFRDRDSVVHVVLQSADSGIAQEAHEILPEFPRDENSLFEYDCLVAFDPNWNQLDRRQCELLERWVAEKAGGMICVAGPVYTGDWAESRRAPAHMDVVKGLYPVTFYTRATASVYLGRFGSEVPWPLQISEAGWQAPFLSLVEPGDDIDDLWGEFDGVYGYYAVKGPKPGATVYARFSDPQTTVDGQPPIYMAGQFYGAGRVIYLGSGEMWRLRGVDNVYFERFYTKLIRYVSQGRLLRDSSRGVLLADKDRCLLGDDITIRASLTDERFRPLALPEVEATIVQPDGMRRPFPLARLAQARAGTYVGQFLATQEGDYRIELVLPSGGRDTILEREVRVRIPDLEVERPQRNDALLSDLAHGTGGEYYVGMAAAVYGKGIPSLASRLEVKDLRTFLTGMPDRDFERLLMAWLLALICGALCLEWLIRRLNRLA